MTSNIGLNMTENNNLNIKVGDLIQSDTGGTGVVLRVPDDKLYHYIMLWNVGDHKEWGADPSTIKQLIKFGKWKVISV